MHGSFEEVDQANEGYPSLDLQRYAVGEVIIRRDR